MFVPSAVSLEWISRSPQQTQVLGAALGRLLQRGDVIGLQGELGAGKTTLVQGMAQGWQAQDSVTSPTFVLENVYLRPDGAPFFHLDAYRLESTAEAEELDLDAFLAEGPLVIEWAERIALVLPPERLWVALEHGEGQTRRLRFSARGPRYEWLLKTLQETLLQTG
jgi:tRNA threonylcarbamoyladenosine biosynthesis protein TsaE